MARQSNTPRRFPIVTTPATPPTGYVDIYAKSDKHLYQLDSLGVETSLVPTGGVDAPFVFFLS